MVGHTWGLPVTVNAADSVPTPECPPVNITVTSQLACTAVSEIVMLATSCLLFTKRVEFVFTCDGSATPPRDQVATAPSSKPRPFTTTSSVVRMGAESGDT